MHLLLSIFLVFAIIAAVLGSPLRVKRQYYYEYRSPSYSARETQQWRYGGYGGNNGEGSTWEGTHPHRISNNDLALSFGK